MLDIKSFMFSRFKDYRVLESYRVLQYITEYYSVTEYNRALQSLTERYRVLQSVTKYYRVLQSITKTNLAHLLGPFFWLVLQLAHIGVFQIF